jgi:hypothetical protein
MKVELRFPYLFCLLLDIVQEGILDSHVKIIVKSMHDFLVTDMSIRCCVDFVFHGFLS